MIKRVLRRLFARVPFVREVYRVIGLGFKVQALERSVNYYDIRIDKIYKNVVALLDHNDRLSAEKDILLEENARLRKEVMQAISSRPLYLPNGSEDLWNEADATRNPIPSDEELAEIFDNVTDPAVRQYAQTHYYRWKHTFERLTAELPARLHKVIEVGAAPFYNGKLREVVRADELVYVGKPFQRMHEGFQGKFVDFNLEEGGWPIQSDSVDCILALELIEHFFHDPMLFFNEANRCLKLGGKLIISTPNIASWKSIRALITHYSPNFYVKFFPKVPLYESHRTEYTYRDIGEFARCSGFSARFSTFNSYSIDVESCLKTLFRECGWDTDSRGDTLFAVLTKIDSPTVRYPEWFYGDYASVASLYEKGQESTWTN